MKLELRDFQRTAVEELLPRLDRANKAWKAAGLPTAVGLTATTGAGKTVIATALIEAVMFGSDEYNTLPDPEAVFLWVTDLPELNLQTRDKMYHSGSHLDWDQLLLVEGTFNEPSLSPGRVYFVHIQNLGANALLTKSGPGLNRTFTFWDVVRATIERSDRMLYVVVDEAHRGMTEGKKAEEANSIVQRFIKGYPEGKMPRVPVVLGISATPERFKEVVGQSDRGLLMWDVPPEDVRESGLIKERTLTDHAGEKQTDPMALFPEAVKAWQSSTEQWAAYQAAYGSPRENAVIPALIVQVENEGGGKATQTDLDAVVHAITEKAGALPDNAFVHSFGGTDPIPAGGRTIRHLDASKIAADPNARVIFYKASLGTGWDCPRAEVLFSFRRAVDETNIAQTIGRMIRTPLARRIEENDALNACYVFLPAYDEKAVDKIVGYLRSSGAEAVAETFHRRTEVVDLPRRDELDQAIKAIEQVPSYIVPTVRARQELKLLRSLVAFLAQTGVDPDAMKREMGELAKMLVAERHKLAGDASFEKEVNDQGKITIRHTTWMVGDKTTTEGETYELDASDEAIDRLFDAARSRLTGEVAEAYVMERRKAEPDALGRIRLEAYALATRERVMGVLKRRALSRVDELRQTHKPAIAALSSAHRAKYDTILRQAPDPLPTDISLPPVATFTKGGEALPKHVYGPEGADAAIHFNNWEIDTLREELAKPGLLGWLRNVERAEWSFRLPRTEGSGDRRPFYPDFLIVFEDDGQVVVDIIDPHDHTKPDAVSKAKGLADYARKNAQSIVRHVDVIAKVKGSYRRLHLEKEAVRKQVDGLTHIGDLEQLYLRDG